MRFRTSWLLAALMGVTLACSDSSTEPGNGNGGGAVGTVTVGNNLFQSGQNGTSNPPSIRSPRGRW